MPTTGTGTIEIEPRHDLDGRTRAASRTDHDPDFQDNSVESSRSKLGSLHLNSSQSHTILAPAQKRSAGIAHSNCGPTSLERRPSELFRAQHPSNALEKISRLPDLPLNPRPHCDDAEQLPGKGQPSFWSHAKHRSAAKERIHSARKQIATPLRSPQVSTKSNPAASAVRSMQRHLSAASSDDERLSASLQTKIDAQLISIEDLKTEIQTLYANAYGLEEKVKQVLNVQRASLTASTGSEPASSTETPGGTTDYNDHFQLIFALHRNLIQEYYDLFRATQYASAHPNAPKEVKNFCHLHQLPSRLWKHGVHNLLEFWRSRLPDSKEYLHAYIYLAYQMFTLLFETVKAFENSWLECLGDLSRYRMAIEQDNVKERDLWLEIADMWYAKAAIPQPNLGRLLHHRAILARRLGIWQMLHFYARSLSTIEPFTVARSSLEVTVFKPNLTAPKFPPAITQIGSKAISRDAASRLTSSFVRMLALNFDQDAGMSGMYATALDIYNETLLDYVSLAGASFQSIGETMSLSCITSVAGWGLVDSARSNGIRLLFDTAQKRQTTTPWEMAAKEGHDTAARTKGYNVRAWLLLFKYTLRPLLSQLGDESVLPFVHTALVFIYSLSSIPGGIHYFVDDDNIPWADLATFLNSWMLMRQLKISSPKFTSSEFPHPSRSVVSGDLAEPEEQCYVGKIPVNENVLPEDRSMHGQFWEKGYLPEDFFDAAPAAEEQPPSARDTFDPAQGNLRIERCIWLGMRIIEAANVATTGWHPKGQWLGIVKSRSDPMFTMLAFPVESRMSEQTTKIGESDVVIAGTDVVMDDQ